MGSKYVFFYFRLTIFLQYNGVQGWDGGLLIMSHSSIYWMMHHQPKELKLQQGLIKISRQSGVFKGSYEGPLCRIEDSDAESRNWLGFEPVLWNGHVLILNAAGSLVALSARPVEGKLLQEFRIGTCVIESFSKLDRSF